MVKRSSMVVVFACVVFLAMYISLFVQIEVDTRRFRLYLDTVDKLDTVISNKLIENQKSIEKAHKIIELAKTEIGRTEDGK